MLIYKITNTITGKVYIGFTSRTLKERWDDHIYASKKKNYYFYNSINKYGPENFELIELEKCASIEELKEKEKIWIAIYNSANRKFGYNSTLGGEGQKANEETKKKLSNANKGEKHYNFGKHLSEEIKRKMSLASPKNMLGKNLSEETKKKLSESHKGKIPWNKGKKTGIVPFSRPILQFDLQDNFIKEWPSGKSIQRELKIEATNIMYVCQEKRKTSGGFKWKYKMKEGIK